MGNKTDNRARYNAASVNRAIESERRRGNRVTAREAQMIHALLRGRD